MASRGRKVQKWCVYVLQCSDGSLYVGVTERLSSRLRAHIRGKAAKRTMNVLPLRLLAVLPVGEDRDHAWYMERRVYWSVTTYSDKPITLPRVDGWIDGDRVYRELHRRFPETFFPGAPGLLTPDDEGADPLPPYVPMVHGAAGPSGPVDPPGRLAEPLIA